MRHHLENFVIMSQIWPLFLHHFVRFAFVLLKVLNGFSKKPNFKLFGFSYKNHSMGKGKGKRKMDDAGTDEQLKDQEFGPVMDTDYHIGSLYARTF